MRMTAKYGLCLAGLLVLPLVAARFGGGDFLTARAAAEEAEVAAEEAGEGEGGEEKPAEPAAEEPAGDEDPEMSMLDESDAALEQRTAEVVERYQNAENDEQRKEIKAELVKVVNAHFEIRQRKRALEIERLEKQLEELRAVVERRNANRAAIIARHFDDLLGGDDLSF